MDCFRGGGRFGSGLFDLFGLWRGLFLVINVAAFGFYGYDKLQSRIKGWRVPEILLLAFAAAGGAVGSLLGQIILNHKNSKSSFKRLFWLIVTVQIIVLTVWCFEDGSIR